MPLGRPGVRSLEALLGREPLREEDPATIALVRRLRHVRRAGEFSRAEFLVMCRWKSPRAAPQYERNPAARVREASRAALRAGIERRRIEALTRLRGVSVPVASAILTLIDPRRYGVLDIRVWQLLERLGAVAGNPRGRGFTVGHWEQYLRVLRRQAWRLRAPVRAVEYTLFCCHRALQTGRLYDWPRRRSRGAGPAGRAGRNKGE
jgi:hypothetical protein